MIAIVTPSLNQGAFLEAAVQSVLTQQADVEYVIVDGGSHDDTIDVIRRYEDRLAAWRSEPDDGQYDAINKGFALTSAEIMGWLNADDFYLPGCLSVVENIFAGYPEVEWITGTLAAIANASGQVVRTLGVARFSREAFFRGFNLPRSGWHVGHFIPQESTFWRRSLWDRAGGRVDASLQMAGDFELWSRFYQHADLWGVRALMGVYRSQPAQKTSLAYDVYLAEAEDVLRQSGGEPYTGIERRLRSRLSLHIASSTVWRLPTAARRRLEERGLVHRTPELVWSNADGRWIRNTEYFV
jgi:glycosyltransferase involved in cell wall biosynthesis